MRCNERKFSEGKECRTYDKIHREQCIYEKGLERQKMNDIDKLEEFREFDDNEYKLYNYLKSNPSVAISGVSAIVLVISFIFRALIYANECRYLKYWHFDVSMIDVYTPNRIYEYVALGFLYVIMTLYMRFIEASLEKYKEGVGLLSFERICLRGIRKEKRWLKRVRRKAKRKKEHYQETELKISRLLDKKSIVEGNKEKLKEISRIGKRKILVTLLLSVMVLTAAMCLFTLLCGNEVSLMESLGASVIMTILFWIVFCVAIKSENEKKKEYKQFDIEKKVEQYQVYINEYKKKSKQYKTLYMQKSEGFRCTCL